MRSLIPLHGSLVPLGLLRRDLADLFGRLFPELPEFEPSPEEGWAPKVDMEETEKGLIVRADLPGVDPADVKVSVTDGVLVIEGARKEETEVKEGGVFRRERLIGRFYRALTLPRGADVEKISATSNKGVMTITIPRRPELEPKRIEVKPEG